MEKYESLEDKLNQYSKSDYYGFHMPGHKRNVELFGTLLPYGLDITEIEGFDDLHHAEEILLRAREKAARVFYSSESFYLINGSTTGNMAAIMSVTERGDKILMARNNHKSVYNAVYLHGLRPIYVYPEFDEKYSINSVIRAESVRNILEREEGIKAVVIVSPTYDGVVSDIAGIAEVVHKYKIPLIVDEAHGAHFGMHEYFPLNSNQLGADLVIHSVHKTLPSLTQTGLIHVNGSLVNRENLKRYLKMLQSSSPSYILMASIDTCVNKIREQGKELFDYYIEKLDNARSKLSKLENLTLVEMEGFDRSKVIISTKGCNISSRKLYDLLRNEYHLQMEMCGATYVTAMTSVGDTEEGLTRLINALLEIDATIQRSELLEEQEIVALPHLQQAENGKQGSSWFYYLYPPGIPFVVPGEIITEEIKDLMTQYEEAGFVIQRG